MMFKTRRNARLFGLSFLATVAFSSCVDEEIAFRDRVLFDDPPAEAMSFLGYTDSQSKLTVCGNCHVGQQGEWVETAHADAWDGLHKSSHAQASCEGCHTVNELGNTVTAQAGHLAFPDERYYDVQCESCHGPGLDHVENPDNDANKPLAPLKVGLDLTFGCGECHSDTHHPFVEDWSQSAHVTVGFQASRDGCNACHEGKAALKAFGVNAEFIENQTGELLPITCAVCHDPHDNTNEGQLRFSVAATNLQENLCARCHDRRSVPDPNSSHGLEPHSPSAALLLGEAGWFPPGAEINQVRIVASHGSEGNERLCATCHVSSFDVTDPDTDGFIQTATGHTFRAIPCVDAQGIPIGGDCELSTEAREFEGCATGPCHLGIPQSAFTALFGKTGDIRALAEELEELLLLVDPNLSDAGGEIDGANPIFTVAEGAFFNLELAQFGGKGRPSERLAYASAAAHNPFLVPELLRASIEIVEKEYDVMASPENRAPARLKSGPYTSFSFPGAMH